MMREVRDDGWENLDFDALDARCESAFVPAN